MPKDSNQLSNASRPTTNHIKSKSRNAHYYQSEQKSESKSTTKLIEEIMKNHQSLLKIKPSNHLAAKIKVSSIIKMRNEILYSRKQDPQPQPRYFLTNETNETVVRRPYVHSSNLQKMLYQSYRSKRSDSSMRDQSELALPIVEAEKAKILVRRHKSYAEGGARLTERRMSSKIVQNTSYCDEQSSIDEKKVAERFNIQINKWVDPQRNDDSSSEFSEKSNFNKKRSLLEQTKEATSNHMMDVENQNGMMNQDLSDKNIISLRKSSRNRPCFVRHKTQISGMAMKKKPKNAISRLLI